MKNLFFCLFLIIQVSAYAQNSFKDERDGRTYSIVTIGDLNWMAEDLKFETTKSHCPNYDETGKECEKANFYAYDELASICPKGWRLPTLTDWKQIVAMLDQEKAVRMMEKNTKIYRMDFLDKYNVFDHNPISIQPVGRTEGNIWQDGYYSDYWTVNEALGDPRFHMHISPYSIVGHAHKHNVNEKKESKNRKFAARCVCEKESN